MSQAKPETPPLDTFDGGARNAAKPVGRRESVGDYQLRYELASGGMATVYLAHSKVAHRGPHGDTNLVALKRIHPHLAGTAHFVRMFHDEARIASMIQHPNVCSVYELGELDGAPFIAMEFLPGETVGRLCHAIASNRELYSDPAWASIVARIVVEAAEGLHAAHELRAADGTMLDVVHRDISPQNILVTYDGVAKVVDFGIARAAHRLQETQTGELKGKFAYMSPEQLRPKKPADRRTDVWALGVVLWEMLALRRLFRRSVETDTILAVMSDPIDPPSRVWPRSPKVLDAIVMRALSRDPDQRYASARDLSRDLQKYLVTAGHPTDPADVAAWMARAFPAGKQRLEKLVHAAGAGATEEAPRTDKARSLLSNSTMTGELNANGLDSKEIDAFAHPPMEDELSGVRVGKADEFPVLDSNPGVVPTSAAPLSSDSVILRSSFVSDQARERVLRWSLIAVAVFLGVLIPYLALRGPERPRAVSLTPTAETNRSTAARETEPEVAGLPVPGDVTERNDEPERVAIPDEPSESDTPERARNERERTRIANRNREAAERAERAERPERVERPQGAGTVAFATPGTWAHVFEGRRELGETPLTLERVSAGPHSYEIRILGRRPGVRRTVTVVADQRTPVVVRSE